MQTDTLTNVLAQIGYGGDKAAHSFYGESNISPQELINSYNSSWLPRKLVDIPVHDALSKWRKWKGEAVDVDAIEAAEKRIQLRSKVEQALKRARLLGGAAIFIGTNVKVLHTPMQPTERIKFLSVFDADECQPEDAGTIDRLTVGDEHQFFSVQGQRVHASRIIPLKGAHCVNSSCYGRSELAHALPAIKRADEISAIIASLVFEAKIDIIKIPNLFETLQDEQGDNLIIKRLSLANQGKSITNALLMDTEEQHDQKQLNFSGLRDLLLSAHQLAAGACGIPATKLLGQSASGLNATGDNELRDYYDKIIDIQNNEIAPALARIDALILNEAGVKAEYQWLPLWQPTAKESSEILNLKADVLEKLSRLQVLTDDQIADAAEQLLGADIPALEEINDVF